MILFLSDAHFGIGSPSEQEDRRSRLFACLEAHADRLDTLYIMGDLFDFWFEWRHVILKEYFPILCKLKSLTSRGIEMHYLAGNHDFALSRFLQDEIGAQTHFNAVEFEHDGKRFYLHHGDGIAPADWGYRILRRVFRNPTNQSLYRLLHPDLGLWLARGMSLKSRNHSGRRWDVDAFAYRQEAERLAAQGYHYAIFSHTHEPLLEPVNGGFHINTGDWLKYFSYLVYESGSLTLKYWGMPYLERSEQVALRTA